MTITLLIAFALLRPEDVSPFSLSGPKALGLMWQLFAVPNDGLGRKGGFTFLAVSGRKQLLRNVNGSSPQS